MSQTNFSYYQFRKELGYQVYLRFEDFDFETRFTGVLETLGFDKVERKSIKDLDFNPRTSKILKVVKATSRVSKQITKSDFLYDNYGPESLSSMGNYDIYRYKNIGMMVFSEYTGLWELGVRDVSDTDALRMIFTRFLSYALAPLGIVGFWGVPVEEGFVVMSPKKARNEAVFIDSKDNLLITYDGVKKIDYELQILRLDSTLKEEVKPMGKEQLISFLSMNTNYLSHRGLARNLKSSLAAICEMAEAYTYPEENFKPRATEEAA